MRTKCGASGWRPALARNGISPVIGPGSSANSRRLSRGAGRRHPVICTGSPLRSPDTPDYRLACCPLLICGDVDHSEGVREFALAAGDEVRQVPDGVRGWVRPGYRRGEGGLRSISLSLLLALLCASAFCPVPGVGVGIAGAAQVAGLGVLSWAGGGVLPGGHADAAGRLRRPGPVRSRLSALALLLAAVPGPLQGSSGSADRSPAPPGPPHLAGAR